MEGIKKTGSTIIVIFLLIFAGCLPIISASYEGMDENIFIEDLSVDENHPAYYNVTRYDLRGFTYSKETIKISYEEAIEINKAFEGIDSSFEQDKIERKREILVEYNLLGKSKGNNSLINQINNHEVIMNFQDDYKKSVTLLFGSVTGYFGPSIINLISFFVGSPIFYCLALGINIEIINPLLPTSNFISNKVVQIVFFLFAGYILVLPFVSPGGYLEGVTFMGNLQELI